MGKWTSNQWLSDSILKHSCQQKQFLTTYISSLWHKQYHMDKKLPKYLQHKDNWQYGQYEYHIFYNRF